jgi:hypothetical protein
MHLLGFDHERLTYRFQGRDYRLTDIHGQPVEVPTPEMWLALRDVLFRKYQRKRVPHKMVLRVDAILAGFGITAPNGTPPASELPEDEDD